MKSITIKPLNIKYEKIFSFLGMIKGFMFCFNKKSKAKLFCFPKELPVDIHMFFCFFPLIIIWLDKNKKINHFAIAKPFRFYQIHKAKWVLEIPFIEKNKKIFKKLRKGMKLHW